MNIMWPYLIYNNGRWKVLLVLRAYPYGPKLTLNIGALTALRNTFQHRQNCHNWAFKRHLWKCKKFESWYRFDLSHRVIVIFSSITLSQHLSFFNRSRWRTVRWRTFMETIMRMDLFFFNFNFNFLYCFK